MAEAALIAAETPRQRWNRENKHRFPGYSKKYAQTSKGRKAKVAAQARYRKNHPDRAKAINKHWLDAHPEYEPARAKQRWADPDSRAKQRGYNQICEQRRRVAEKSPGEAALTTAQWREIRAWFDGRCAYCFAEVAKPEIDHVIAVSRGGLHVASNVAPACRWCNRSKNGRDLMEWLFPKRGASRG